MNMPKNCAECDHAGNYTEGPYSRNPHYCCELIWQLFKEDYRVDEDKIDPKCPLKDKRISSYIDDGLWEEGE